MAQKIGIALVTEEAETERAVAKALAETEHLTSGIVCRNLVDLLPHLKQSPSPAVLVDIDPQPKRILKELDPITSRLTQTRFVVLARDLRNDLVLEAMQSGARHFLVKKSIPTELAGVLQRLVLDGAARTEGLGAVVTFLSASGGCGATTLAVNLASELHLLSTEPALIVDMDTSYGAVATYLGVGGRYGLSDVMAKDGRVDRELITTTAMVHSQGIHVLASPASTNFSNAAPITYHHLDAILRACRDAYRYTVVDAPRVSMDVASALGGASLLTLIVLQLTVKDIRIARSMFSALTERGVVPDKILCVANRYERRGHMLTADEAQKALGGLVPLQVANDFRSAINAINFGRLLSEAAPKSAMRQDLRKLAERIVEAHMSHSSLPLR